MPDLRMPDLSRRTVIALVLMIAGLVAIVLGLLGGAGSSGGASGKDENHAINPVSPLGPGDKDSRRPIDKDPLADVSDPFSSSFGDKGPRKVTVRVSASGPVGIGIRYRGGHKTLAVSDGSYSKTRTVKGGAPLAIVGIRLGPHTGRGTCRILVDGVEVASRTVGAPYGVTTCVG